LDHPVCAFGCNTVLARRLGDHFFTGRARRSADGKIKPTGKMERASRLIRALRLPGDTLNLEELACAAWPAAVGRRIAVHARAARMVRTRLVVEVEDAVWQRQLFALSGQILRNIEKSIGPGVVEDIQFRVAPRKREPQRETRAAADLSLRPMDEAEAIPDPVLRGIYRASKKKALA
jgi:hypothetical protein